MDCPRCGRTDVTSPECPACGVLVAKARSPRARPEPAPVHPAAWRSLILPALGFALLAAGTVAYLRRSSSQDAPRAATSRRAGAPAPALPPMDAGAPPEADLARTLAPPAAPPSFTTAGSADAAAAADDATAKRLISRLQAQVAPTPDDVNAARDLFARHPAEARDLYEGVLLAAAVHARDQRRFDDALAFADRAQEAAPASVRARRVQLALRLTTNDWAGAEQAGRALLALAPADAEGVQGLAYALVRQDRTREAVELLTSFLAAHEDAEARNVLARLQREQGVERKLEEAKLSHFHVRYDGDEHEEVGREILRLLDRHYATLARSFDYEPTQPIAVILLSKQSYYDATGAPAWSGGQYDSFDGRVRIPIAGLTSALSPELDQTLIHELTHSFVADISGGIAPRELHEGTAQYMEGRRIAQLDAERLRALADGRMRGSVGGFYFSSLWLVEDLVAQRGTGGLNDLLRSMSTTGNVDQAFRNVYGSDFAALQRQAAERLKQRYGS
jgi:tetratricopeptide (TPR) repeat protein